MQEMPESSQGTERPDQDHCWQSRETAGYRNNKTLPPASRRDLLSPQKAHTAKK